MAGGVGGDMGGDGVLGWCWVLWGSGVVGWGWW